MVALDSLYCILFITVFSWLKDATAPSFTQSNVNFFFSTIAKIASHLQRPLLYLIFNPRVKLKLIFIKNCDWLGHSRFPRVRSLARI